MKGFFYTNVQLMNKRMYVRGYKDGEYITDTISYKPTIYIPTQEDSEWRSLDGNRLKPIKMTSIDSMTEYVSSVGLSMPVYGFTEHQESVYSFINELMPDDVKYDSSIIRKLIFDIEIESDGGFPDIWGNPYQRINAITIWMKDLGFITWGLHNSYTPMDDSEEYRMFDDEGEMLHDFCKTFAHEKPDIISGWNIDGFDIPYIINRISNHFNPDWVKLLSPWKLKPRERVSREDRSYDIPGVTSFDYMRLYKKFNLSPRESYSLNSIASVELGEKKVDYSEFTSLLELYKNDWQKFIEYNIHDVRLVASLDEKMKFFDLAITYAYLAKVKFEDVFGTVKYWDVYIHNHLYKKKIAVPPKIRNSNDVSYPGGYVKNPLVGMHSWIGSFDLNSLYPNIIVQYNLSPETFVESVEPYKSNSPDKEDIVQGIINGTIDRSVIESNDVILAANGWYFTKEKQGFLPEMVETGYEMRKHYKGLMIKAQEEYERTMDPKTKILAGQYEAMQYALKISLNALYGALGNVYFRYFDVRLAEAVTLTGQATILLTEKNTNEYLNKVIGTKDKDYVVGIDTDSVFLCLDEFIKKVYGGNAPDDKTKVIDVMDRFSEDKLIPIMSDGYDRLYEYLNAFKQRMVIKRESLGDKGLWVAKKRYVINVHDNEGVRYHEPKLKIKGLEIVRTSTPEICRDAIKEAVKVMFDKGESETQEYIRRFRKLFTESPPDKIAFPRGVNNIEKWSTPEWGYGLGTPIHIRASIIYNKAIEKFELDKKYEPIRNGDKIKFLYLKKPNPVYENVISFPTFLPPEIGLDEYIDYDLQFEKAFISPIKNLLDAIGWEVEEKNSLEDLFE